MNREDSILILAKESFGLFSKAVFPSLEFADFYKTYYCRAIGRSLSVVLCPPNGIQTVIQSQQPMLLQAHLTKNG